MVVPWASAPSDNPFPHLHNTNNTGEPHSSSLSSVCLHRDGTRRGAPGCVGCVVWCGAPPCGARISPSTQASAAGAAGACHQQQRTTTGRREGMNQRPARRGAARRLVSLASAGVAVAALCCSSSSPSSGGSGSGSRGLLLVSAAPSPGASCSTSGGSTSTCGGGGSCPAAAGGIGRTKGGRRRLDGSCSASSGSGSGSGISSNARRQADVGILMGKGGSPAGPLPLLGRRGGGIGGGGGKSAQQQVCSSKPKPLSGAELALAEEQREKASTLWTVKLLFLLFYGSLGSVMPYLPVYYHSLGLPDKQIGQLGAITPAVTFVVAPLWGALADGTGKHKDVLLFTFVASVVSRLLFIWRTSFGWLAFLVFCTAVLNAPVRPLLDSSVLSLLDDKREYGKQRLWGQFGFGLAGCIVGPCLMNHKFGGYKAAFYVHALISLPTLFIMRRFDPTPRNSAVTAKGKGKGKGKKGAAPAVQPRFREGLGLVVRNPDNLIFFLMVFVIGVSSGVIENFAYKRLREVGGEGTVMGVSRFFSSVTGVPMFWYSGHVTKRLSVMGVLILSMCSYILRFLIYASIRNPWQGLPAEALRGFTFAAMWASSTYYTHRISPPGLSATMLGFLNGMYGGLGQSTGALIGGSLSQRFGTPKTFLLAAAVDTGVVLLFTAYWFLHPNATRIKEEED